MKTKKKAMQPKRVQLIGLDGVKRNLKFPPTTPKADVAEFKLRAKRLIKSHRSGFAPCDADMRFMATCGEPIRKKLQLLGVVGDAGAGDKEFRLGPFLSRVSELGTPTARRKKADVATKLQKYFGQDKDIRQITALEAQEFRKALAVRWKLCETSTVPRHIGYCSAMLQVAVEDGVIARNPFAKISKVVKTNRAKWHYVTPEETQAIWENLENDEDRLRFVLLRYLGLRAPSEMNALSWDCFDWDAGTVLIKSQKLAHQKDGGFRRCPFSHPDILPLLQTAFGKRTSDKASVLPRISGPALARKVKRWLGRAGVSVWPQLLTNFRRSAATDARDHMPAHVAAGYFGHSDEIFRAHYGIHKPEHIKAFCDMPSLLSRAIETQ